MKIVTLNVKFAWNFFVVNALRDVKTAVVMLAKVIMGNVKFAVDFTAVSALGINDAIAVLRHQGNTRGTVKECVICNIECEICGKCIEDERCYQCFEAFKDGGDI